MSPGSGPAAGATTPLPRLLGIVDHGLCAQTGHDPVGLSRELLEAGLPMLWLRCRGVPPRAQLEVARAVAADARAAGVPLVLSDRVDIAQLVGAGVHLPANGLPAAEARRILPGAIVGVSAHDAGELRSGASADYATLSPLRQSVSKPGYGGHGTVTALRALARRSPVPVFALGGVRPEDAALLGDVHGLAVMGALHGLTGRSPREAVGAFLEAVARASPAGALG